MRRRQFIMGLGSAAAWPLAARAQQGARVRRIGYLAATDENDPLMKSLVAAFNQALAYLGWTDGRNLRMDLRSAGGDINLLPALARELVGTQPDIILTGTTVATTAIQRETRTIPIVLVGVTDPVASHIVPRLNQPGGNITGFANLEASLGGKYLELLSEIVLGSSGPQSCSIPTPHPSRLICPQLRRRPAHSRSSQSLRTFVAT